MNLNLILTFTKCILTPCFFIFADKITAPPQRREEKAAPRKREKKHHLPRDEEKAAPPRGVRWRKHQQHQKAAPPKRRKQHHTKDRWNSTSSNAQRVRKRQLHHPKRRTGDYHFTLPHLPLPYLPLLQYFTQLDIILLYFDLIFRQWKRLH